MFSYSLLYSLICVTSSLEIKGNVKVCHHYLTVRIYNDTSVYWINFIKRVAIIVNVTHIDMTAIAQPNVLT